MRIAVLGAGFGGLELTTRISEELGDDVDVVLIDRSDGFVFGYSKLAVMFGRAEPQGVFHPYRDIVKPGVEFVSADILSIDPEARTVETTEGMIEADILVIALGADLDPTATPGLLEGGYEFYTEPGAFALQEVLANFEGGRVIVGVTSAPFKCPPAPSETVLLLHDFLVDQGVREKSSIALTMPLPAPIPPSPDASGVLLAAFAERDIEWFPQTLVTALDPDRKRALTAGGDEMPYDLFLGVPKHHVPAVVESSGLAVDGWIPVDPYTLQTKWADVYAVGDVTSVGTPKAGTFSEGQAAVVASRIIERARGEVESTTYDGASVCYLELGFDQMAVVNVTFFPGTAPVGNMVGPAPELLAEKVEFGRSRIQRWFGNEWVGK